MMRKHTYRIALYPLQRNVKRPEILAARIMLCSLLLWSTLSGGGCAVGPRFHAPETEMPTDYLYRLDIAAADSIVNFAWWENFGDTTLNRLIIKAFTINQSLAAAASMVWESQLQMGIARNNLAPVIDLGLTANKTKTGTTVGLQGGGFVVNSIAVGPTVSWEVDLFGGLRRQAESAEAQWLASEQNYRSVMLSLASEVATTYFTLLQYDLSLRIAQLTYDSGRESEILIDSMLHYGMATVLDLEQARTLTATAAAAIPQYERARVQTMLSLNALVGENPRLIEADGRRMLAEMLPAEVPAGLPSALLDRRPDILQAYYQVKSANAQIGVAVANRYPSITLTGEGGLFSSTLKGLFEGSPFGWLASLSVTQPITNFGNNKRKVEIAREQNRQAILAYELTVVTALGEVESALEGIMTYGRQVVYYRELLETAATVRTLTRELYAHGLDTYLEVLDADRQFFTAQLNYAQLLAEQLSEYVALYKALGGGW